MIEFTATSGGMSQETVSRAFLFFCSRRCPHHRGEYQRCNRSQVKPPIIRNATDRILRHGSILHDTLAIAPTILHFFCAGAGATARQFASVFFARGSPALAAFLNQAFAFATFFGTPKPRVCIKLIFPIAMASPAARLADVKPVRT